MAINFGGIIYAWSSGKTIALFIVAGILLLAFGYQQASPKMTSRDTRVFPIHFFTIREPLCCFVLMAACSSGVFLVMYYVPLYFQFAKGVAPLHTGVNLLPFIVTTTVAIMVNGAVLSKIGYYKPWYLCGSAIALIGGVLLCELSMNLFWLPS
jgi:hypothetical protein